MNIMGGGLPMAKRGAAGAAGGRLTHTGDAASSINWDRTTSGRNWPHPPDTQVVDLPVPALDRAFKTTDPALYIETPKSQVVDYAKSGAPMSLPEIGVAGRRLGFQNGRNRFAVARDNGDAMIPVVVHRDNIEDVLATVYGADRMARARQMGFRTDIPLYYGSGEEFSSLKAVPTTAAGMELPGVPLAIDPALAGRYAENSPARGAGLDARPQVYPLFHRAERPTSSTLDGSETLGEVVATLRDAFDAWHDAVMIRNYPTPGGLTGQNIIIVRDANQLRSPNAVFDPARKFDPHLLAGLGGISVVGAGFGAPWQHETAPE
jgi:hypothetical protein